MTIRYSIRASQWSQWKHLCSLHRREREMDQNRAMQGNKETKRPQVRTEAEHQTQTQALGEQVTSEAGSSSLSTTAPV